MNDDYLWDKSGEPDAEIQELENILGSLKYQPLPLEVPDSLIIPRRRFFIPMSLAAVIALVVLGLGLWLVMNRRQQAPVTVAPLVTPTSETPATAITPQPKEIEVAVKNNSNENASRREPITRSQPRRVKRDTSVLSSAQRAEAEKAKEQLFVALRLASEKLNLAQKRTQGAPPAHLIRNQHKVG